MFSDFKSTAASVEILVAARKRGNSFFLDTLMRVLENASSPAVRVASVTSWFDEVKVGGREHLDICGIVVVSERIAHEKDGAVLMAIFRLLLPQLIGQKTSPQTERVLFVHDREKQLVTMLGDMWNVDTSELLKSATREGFAWFSFARDFVRARRAKAAFDWMQREFDPEQEPGLPYVENEPEPPPPTTSVVKTAWRAIVVEGDKEFGEQLKEFLIDKAARQDIHLDVDVRHTVHEALLGLARTPFAISINPRLALAPHGKIEEWGGLEIIPSAHEREVPVILRSSAAEDRIRGALRQKRIKYLPTKTVSVDLLNQWTSDMLACLMRRDH